jgi:hypothetical protein
MTALSDFRPVQTPVGDQGARGTCVGFAVTAAHEWMRPSTLRSVEDALWAAHRVGGDPAEEGTSVYLALSGLDLHHHAEDSAWPYGMPPFPAQRPAEACDPARRVPNVGWRLLPTCDLDAVAAEVARGAAVVLTLNFVPGAWPSSGKVDAAPGRKAFGRHAVLAVGTLADPAEPAESQTLIKNSWGADWGMDGYGFVTRRYLSNYGHLAHVLEPVL